MTCADLVRCEMRQEIRSETYKYIEHNSLILPLQWFQKKGERTKKRVSERKERERERAEERERERRERGHEREEGEREQRRERERGEREQMREREQALQWQHGEN